LVARVRRIQLGLQEMTTPLDVLQEFHRLLVTTIWGNESLIPVLRGSLVMKLWFGDRARPAADIDFECFEGPSTLSEEEREELELGETTGYGNYGEFTSLVDFGKAMCRYAAEQTSTYQWSSRVKSLPLIEFYHVDPPEPQISLWVYGTPGERYFTGWQYNGPPSILPKFLQSKQVPKVIASGLLQIDLAEPGVYRLDQIGTEKISVLSDEGQSVEALTYSRGMMLAAKLSWLMRSCEFTGPPETPLRWSGEPKDLFDAHLLICAGEIDPADLQKSLVAVGSEDDLNWSDLVRLIDCAHHVSDATFGNWQSFADAHPEIVALGPAASLQMIAERLPRLLGQFWLPDEEPFLQSIDEDRSNSQFYAVYADWLEERGDSRAEFLREFVRIAWSEPMIELLGPAESHDRLQRLLSTTSLPWLHRLFARGRQMNAVCSRIAAGQLQGMAIPVGE
jgi:uncharacterized protein (TIGR02996 family)